MLAHIKHRREKNEFEKNGSYSVFFYKRKDVAEEQDLQMLHLIVCNWLEIFCTPIKISTVDNKVEILLAYIKDVDVQITNGQHVEVQDTNGCTVHLASIGEAATNTLLFLIPCFR